MTRVLLGTVVLATCVLPPRAEANAQTRIRVVVDRFEGPRATRIRNHLVKGLAAEKSVELIDSAEIDDVKEAKRLGSGPLSKRGMKVVSRELRADVVVQGETARRPRWTLDAYVYRAKDGQMVGEHQWQARKLRGMNVVADTVFVHLEEPFAAAMGVEADGEAPWYNNDGVDVPGEEEDDDVIPDDQRWDWLQVALVGGTMYRSLTAEATVLNNGREPGGPDPLNEERSYSSAGIGHMELGIESAFYPGAIGETQPFPYTGLLFRFRHSLGLSTEGCRERTPVNSACTDSDRYDIDTTQSDLFVGLRNRLRLLGQQLELTFDVGFGLFSFNIDKEGLLELERFSVVPPVEYSYLNAELGGSYAVLQALTVGLRFGYHIGFGVGTDAKEVWGVDSTGGSGLSVALQAKIDATELVYENLFFLIDLQYMTFVSDFAGQTQCVSEPCNDDATDRWERWPSAAGDPNDVTGGIKDSVVDHYFRMSLGIGYAFN